MIDMTGIFRKKPDIVTRAVVDECLLIPIKGKLADMRKIFALTPVSEFIWEELDGETPLDMILDRIVSDLDVEEDQARGDLVEFVGALIDAELVEQVAGQGA